MMDDAEDEECPVCCESLDATDKAVNYCECGYRMCIWCWNRLMETAVAQSLPGKCPNCRSLYDKEKITMSQVDPQLVMEERRKKKEERKKNPGAVPKNRKDLVISVNRVGPWAAQAAKGATGSTYVTFIRIEDAVRCIDAIDGAVWGGKQVKACFGTTKYCNAFLKNVICNNPDCLYLHDIADEADSFYKDEVQDGVQLVRQQLLEGLRNRGKLPTAPTVAAVGTTGAAAAAATAAAAAAATTPPPPPPPSAAGKATAAIAAATAAVTAAVSRAPATAAIPIPLKRNATPAAAGPATNAWGTTPDSFPTHTSPHPLTGTASWAAAAGAKTTAPLVAGPLADQEWPSLGPAKEDGEKPPDEVKQGVWGDGRATVRAASASLDGDAPSKPMIASTTTAGTTTTGAQVLTVRVNKVGTKVISLVKPNKANKAAAAAAAAVASPKSRTGSDKEGQMANGVGSREEQQANAIGAGATDSKQPADALKRQGKAGGKPLSPSASGGIDGAPSASAVAAASAAAAAAVANAVAAVHSPDAASRALRAEQSLASASGFHLEGPGVGPSMAAPKIKGPPPGFTAPVRAPSSHPPDVEPSVIAAVRAALPPPTNTPSTSPFLTPSQDIPTAGTAESIISPSDEKIASPPRPAANGMLSALFRGQSGSNGALSSLPPTPTSEASPSTKPAASVEPSAAPSTYQAVNASVAHWVSPGAAADAPAANGVDPSMNATTTDNAFSFTAASRQAAAGGAGPKKPPPGFPVPAAAPPGFSQPMYAGLRHTPGFPSTSESIDVNAMFSQFPPNFPEPSDWSQAPPTATPFAAAPSRQQSRFAFAREEDGPPRSLPRPIPEPHNAGPSQSEELSRLFQKIAPGASVHVGTNARGGTPTETSHSGNGFPNGFDTPHSPNPGLALLAQLQRKQPAAEPPTSSAPPAPHNPSTPPMGGFADPAIMAAKNSLGPGGPSGAPLGPPQQQAYGTPPYYPQHHRPGELNVGPGGIGFSAPGEPSAAGRGPVRGPPPGFHGAFHNAFPDFSSQAYPGGQPGMLQRQYPNNDGFLQGGSLMANGHALDHQKGFTGYGNRPF